jgi:hypothetical protein
MNKSPVPEGLTPAQLIDFRIKELDDWRGALLAEIRSLIKVADPHVTEDWKWNIPVWNHDGLICTGETYKEHVKITFAKGAKIPDPKGVFNASLDGNARRAIDLYEGDKVPRVAFKALIKEALKLNQTKTVKKK